MRPSIFKRKKAKVYLGALAVTPRNTLQEVWDSWDMTHVKDFDAGLKAELEKIFSLPPVEASATYENRDLGLDVILVEYTNGSWGAASGDVFIPYIWRPKVVLKSRLYWINSGKTKAKFSSVQKLPWSVFVSKMFTLNGIFQIRPMFSSKDMQELLFLSCHQLLEKMVKKNDL